MFRSFRIGTAFGIPLYLNPTFLLLPLYVLGTNWHEGLFAVLFIQAVLFSIFGCVLLHELGHALMGRWFGIVTRDITLYPIGGVARLESTGGKPHEEIAIAVAGPAVNLAIVILLAPLLAVAAVAGWLPFPPTHEAALGGGDGLSLLSLYLLYVMGGNLVLLLFNLIPAFPMDGGRVLRALLSLGLPRLRATEIAAVIGLFLAGGLGLAGLFLLKSPSLVLVSVFVAFAGQMELASLRQREQYRRQAEEEPLDVLPVDPILLEPFAVPRMEARPFTGVAWDRDRGVWVRWVNGVPVD